METPAKTIWSSPAITTALFGAAAAVVVLNFGGHSDQPGSGTETEMRRNEYPTREACTQDYSEDQCIEEQVASGAGGGGSGIAYIPRIYGPWYNPALTTYPGPGRSALATGSPTLATKVHSQVTRSGFGQTARSYGGFRGG
jgi:uncharacterized protein YgiB involved in biofilm formation